MGKRNPNSKIGTSRKFSEVGGSGIVDGFLKIVPWLQNALYYDQKENTMVFSYVSLCVHLITFEPPCEPIRKHIPKLISESLVIT